MVQSMHGHAVLQERLTKAKTADFTLLSDIFCPYSMRNSITALVSV